MKIGQDALLHSNTSAEHSLKQQAPATQPSSNGSAFMDEEDLREYAEVSDPLLALVLRSIRLDPVSNGVWAQCRPAR